MASDMARYADMMEDQFPRQFAFAVSDTINTMARTSRDQFRKKEADKNFDTKSKYLRSVVDDRRNTSRDIPSMESAFGELYKKFGKKTTTQLGVHDTGGVVKPKSGRKKLHDATRAGRGGSMRKPLRKAFAKANVKTVRDLKPNAKQRARGFYPTTAKGKAIGLIAWAMRSRYTGLLRMKSPEAGTYGDFKVMRGGKIKMVRNLETSRRRVGPTNWMRDSYTPAVNKRDDYYADNMGKQIDYLKTTNKL